MSTLGPKQALFAQFAAIAKTLGHGHRLELLEQLAQGERTVEVLAQRTSLSVANASQHLQHLRRAGLLKSRRQGKFVHYTLADDGILDVLSALRRIAERNVAEVERVVRSYFNKLDELEPVTRKQLLKLIREGAVTVLDVRPPDEFCLGPCAGCCEHSASRIERAAIRNQSRPRNRCVLPRRVLRVVL
jgi:DNA-binding transcriptional ArsR family regulator